MIDKRTLMQMIPGSPREKKQEARRKRSNMFKVLKKFENFSLKILYPQKYPSKLKAKQRHFHI